MKPRIVIVQFSNGTASADFMPRPGRLHRDPETRRANGLKPYWTCIAADHSLNFLLNRTAHHAHLALAVRELKWSWA